MTPVAETPSQHDNPISKPIGMDMSDVSTPIKVGEQLLRQYTNHLDPLDTNVSSNPHHNDLTRERTNSLSTASTASTSVDDSPKDSAGSLPPSPIFSLRAPKSFLGHRKGTQSIDSSIPQQSIQKAMQSRPFNYGMPPVSIAASLSKSLDPQRRPSMTSSQLLSAALSDLSTNPNKTPSTARFALASPCFFHQRFDDAINVDRVLEEIAAEDDGMSHGRLMQTATSVREISKQLQRRPIKRAVRNVMIVTKCRDNHLVTLTRELAEWLLTTPRYNSDVGVNVYVDHKLRPSKRFNAPSLLAQNPKFERMLRYWTPDLCWTSPEKFDLVLTLGGDGTVLFTSYLFQRIVPPILSFSLGSLGFLTNFEFGNYKTSLGQIMGDAGMRVNLRMRFTCTVYRANPEKKSKGKDRKKGEAYSPAEMIEGEQFEVLNELVIDRGPSPYVSNLELYGDDDLLTVVQADGCIFSTPTGSTAYSLSAGGPLTHPSIPGILLTPICPHTLSFRPMVLSDSLLLKVCVPRNSRSTAYASFDGKRRVELRRGDCVQVEAGRYPFPTVVSDSGAGGEWFESVRRALRWNNRGAMQKGWGEGEGRERGKGKVEASSRGVDEDDDDADDDDGEEEEHEEEEWDINPDPINLQPFMMDSGIGASEVGGSSTSLGGSSSCTSPKRL